MFLEQNHQQVSYSLYWSIFVYNFNLAFGHSAKDVCSSCVKFRNAINDPDLTAEEKQNKILYTLHRRRARQFYDTLNDTYYSRQVYFYVFGVVRHRGRAEPQSRHEINLYTWLEYENSKDSNIVASALQHYFTSVASADLRQCQRLRLFSDSCYGQNKNINVLCCLPCVLSCTLSSTSLTSFLYEGTVSYWPEA
ncbi:hypothetical protein PO909_011298 [Leuciscus waleckii]